MLTDHIRFNRIIFRDRIFTPDYLDKAIDGCARYLDAHIHSNSPIVYLFAPNHLKTIIAFLAIVKTGRVCLLVDPKVGELEYQEMLADTPPSVIITIDPAPITFDYQKEIAFSDNQIDTALVSELEDVCLLLYTAAEDGFAKAAMLTHANLLAGAEAITAEHRVDEVSITCALLPFNHIFALQCGVITPLIGNGAILIADISEIQKIGYIAEELCAVGATHLYSIPLIYHLLSKSQLIDDLGRRVYSMISGGYQLPHSLRGKLEKKWGIHLYEGYGLTETAGGCMWQRTGDTNAGHSLGMPSKGCQVMIQDDTGKVMPFGGKGEICIKSPQVTKGYFNHHETTRHIIIDGWLHTGDYGKLDEAGHTFFLGLKKRMFNVAGRKIYPEEVRRLMMKNENVENVELWSDYSALTGDRIKARVTLKNHSTESEMEFFHWSTKAIGPNKIPHHITFKQE